MKQRSIKFLGKVGHLMAAIASPLVAVLFLFHVSCLHSSAPRTARSENACPTR